MGHDFVMYVRLCSPNGVLLPAHVGGAFPQSLVSITRNSLLPGCGHHDEVKAACSLTPSWPDVALLEDRLCQHLQQGKYWRAGGGLRPGVGRGRGVLKHGGHQRKSGSLIISAQCAQSSCFSTILNHLVATWNLPLKHIACPYDVVCHVDFLGRLH
jgi:hypothetical protein